VTDGPVLVTGGGGQLASDLEDQLGRLGVEVHARARSELDITDDRTVADTFARLRPTVVFNCAAFHNVDVCEGEEDRAFEVNTRAVKRIAERCEAHGATLIHLSTNYVFDGSATEPYGELDRPSPRSVYAISKLGGEHAALAYAPGALVVRTAGLYGRFGSASKGGNFVVRMIGRAREQRKLSVVADQRLSPTYTTDLAAALIQAVDRGVNGLLHITNGGDCSWYEFTRGILELAAIDVPLEPVATVVPEGGADRPLNGVLARPRADAAGLAELRPWRDALADYMLSAGLTPAAAR